MEAPSSLRRVWAVIASITVVTSFVPLTTLAATPTAQLFLRPHCDTPKALEPTGDVPSLGEVLKNSPDLCGNFRIRDPQSQETPDIKVGETLDLDVMLYNPTHTPVSSVRLALSYDPQVLNGKQLGLLSSLPIPTPGEQNFFPDEGSVKITASANPGAEPINALTAVARIQFTITRSPRAGVTPIGFDDIQPGVLQGATEIIGIVGGEDKNIITSDLGSLVVKTAPGDVPPPPMSSSAASSEPTQQQQSSAASSDMMTQSSSSAFSSVQGDHTSFVLLQVQNLRVGTEGGSISITWDALRSVDTAGYNIYYGTEKGRYIQRHSVTPDSTSHVIRGLPVGAVYYLAVRAFNGQNEESAFSREVMIKTGDPRSSTAPLNLQDLGPQGQNPLGGNLTGSNVPGQSGLPNAALLMIICIAVIGTAFAFRRQLTSR